MTTLFAQSSNYESMWKQVETFEVNGSPKSALEVVEKIEAKAKKDTNEVQLIKTLLFKSKFSNILEEDAQLKVVTNFKEMISKSSTPTKNILENMLAKMYWDYFQTNRYKFYNRTNTANKVDEIDFRTWDLETLFSEISNHFEQSLKNGLVLQTSGLEDYEVLITAAEDSRNFRPSLFDLLSQNALEFYQTTENSITQPAFKFELIDPDYLSTAINFSAKSITSKDSTSLQLKALFTYQNLIKFHLNAKNELAATDVDIARLNYVKSNGRFPDKNTKYLAALETALATTVTPYAKALYQLQIAKHYKEQGDAYNALQPETHDQQWQLKKALTISEEISINFPESVASNNALLLKENILKPSLRLTTESFIPSNSESRILVTYKNHTNVWVRAYKIPERKIEALKEIYNEQKRIDYIEKLPLEKSWTSKLKNKGDYQTHSTEIEFPAMTNGHFVIVAKSNNNAGGIYAHSIVQFTNFVLVEKEDETNSIFQIVDRTNGEPVKDATCTITYRKNRKKGTTSKKLVTDSNGRAFLEKTELGYRNVELTVKQNGQEGYFKSYNYYYKNQNQEIGKSQNAFVFTDRSIYRPGQTIYFKGIAIETENQTSKVLPKSELTAALYDANGENISNLNLTTNEFGSVAGEFIIPIGGITGGFYIEIDSNHSNPGFSGTSYFSVEEYKRPKFEAIFNPVTKSYQVNDSVVVQGRAMAFAGSKISDAKVTYRVKRQVKYPRWYYYYRSFNSVSEGQEIAFGDTKTDTNGAFEIQFEAQPDLKADKASLPIFNYEITADVTDINGETQSITTIINIGYHTLVLDLNVAKQLDQTNKKHIINISSENLNNEFVATKGTVEVYKLIAPKSVLRNRPWHAPDYNSFTKKEFQQKYPHDAYQNEDDLATWNRGTRVLSSSFDTAKDRNIDFGNMKRWEAGNYVIIATSKDAYNQDIEAITYTNIYNAKDIKAADNQLFTATMNQSVFQPGDTMELTFASASHVFITVDVEKDNHIASTQIIELNNSTKAIKVPVTIDDLGGFVVHYHYTALNSFNTDVKVINVPVPSKELRVETNTFRDKLQPGTPENWSFKINGPSGEKVAAEMVASMYDASLDQFKPHNWSFSPQPDVTYYSRYRSKASMSFGTKQLNVHDPRSNSYIGYQTQQYDRFNWYGFTITHQNWDYQRYLSDLRYRQRIEATYVNTIKAGFINGTVVDADGKSLAGVNVVVRGASIGTQTDVSGNFSIAAKKGETIVVSYLGYRSERIKIADKNSFSIQLQSNDNGLSEVIIESNKSMSRSRKSAKLSSAPMAEGDLGIEQFNSEEEVVLSADEIRTIPGANSANEMQGAQEKSPKFDDVQIRKNLQETAFFFPALQTDPAGNVSFSFTTPEALTRWKVQLLSHTKELESAITTLETVTQKELMVMPNAPRFLREGDQITISSKISNLSKKILSGNAILKLTDAVTGESIDSLLGNNSAILDFTISEESNTQVSWNLSIPENVDAVQYQVIAKAGAFSDGEQNALPVLSNRMLVTETLPMWVRSNETKTFTLDKLANTTSTTLKNHKLTLEVTSNPAWYAVQSLPYLMEYPYECNEQTFARYYANSLASFISNENPRIKAVFEQWKSSDALLSNLEKNQELKSLLIEETPWLRQATSEAEQKKRIALLFDLNKMDQELLTAANKLSKGQMNSGAWPWFNGGRESRYITQHIISGFGHLKQLGVPNQNDKTAVMIDNAIDYLDREFIDEYNRLKRYNKEVDYSMDHLSNMQLQYLYMRSFYPEKKMSKKVEGIANYYLGQIDNYWLKRNLYAKGMMSLVMYRNNKIATSSKIIASLKEYSITSDELGMYWKENNASWYWYQAPIETQALMIEAFSEIENDAVTVDNLKIWLLKNKETNRWSTTKATTEAVYALLLQGSDWLSVTDALEVSIGGKKVDPKALDDVAVEAGTGYYKTSWNTSEISKEQATVTMKKTGDGIAWGGLYWQYFEDLDKITTAKTPLQLKKKLFLKKNTAYGEELTDISKNITLQVGDLVRVRIELKVDREMDYVHMKDMRAAGFEPINVLSSYKYQDGLGYYEATKDAATNFFFERLPKGVFVFEYDLRVNNAGNFSNGITTIQCMYAPEFTSHSKGIRVEVAN